MRWLLSLSGASHEVSTTSSTFARIFRYAAKTIMRICHANMIGYIFANRTSTCSDTLESYKQQKIIKLFALSMDN